MLAPRCTQSLLDGCRTAITAATRVSAREATGDRGAVEDAEEGVLVELQPAPQPPSGPSLPGPARRGFDASGRETVEVGTLAEVAGEDRPRIDGEPGLETTATAGVLPLEGDQRARSAHHGERTTTTRRPAWSASQSPGPARSASSGVRRPSYAGAAGRCIGRRVRAVPLLESVPNISEGHDAASVAAIAGAFGSAGARLLDTHLDGDHNRAVITLVGNDRALEDGLVAGIGEALRRIDLRVHRGAHPRVGAVDVVPVVPLDDGDLARAVRVARAVAERVGGELRLPVFLYGAIGNGRRPAFFRRGGPAELQRRVDAGELEPAFGPRRLAGASGATLIGVRRPLVAFNLEVHGTLDAAREVAALVRESSGGLPGVQALGLELGDGRIQVSTNLIDVGSTELHELVSAIATAASTHGLEVGEGELVGLVPGRCVADAARAAGIAEPLDSRGVPTMDALAAAAGALRLERLDADRVLEWHLAE